MTTGSNVSGHGQRGATLVIALVMMLMLMLLVGSAYTLSGTNLKAVGNMQFRDEAIASANIGILRVLDSAFTTTPTAEPLDVDINNDGTRDYIVQMAVPECTSARAEATQLCGNGNQNMCAKNWNTLWTLTATVTDEISKAAVKVRAGVRVQLNDSQKRAVCGV